MEYNPKVRLDVRLNSTNTRWYTSVTQAADIERVDSLPGLHAFTGFDVTAAFLGKGKIRPLNMKEKNSTVLLFPILVKQYLSHKMSLLASKSLCVLYTENYLWIV